MGKNFWPVWIIVMAVLLAATWKFAPTIGEKIPQDSRDTIVKLVAKCMGRKLPEASTAATPAVPAAQPRQNGVKPLGKATESAVKPLAPAAQPTAPVAKAPVKRQAAAPAPRPAEEDELPSLKGIMQEDPNNAKWGVLNQATTVEGLDGEEKGVVAGGRIFLIESREQQKKTLWLIGNFSPTPMDEKVRVPATSLYCFSGNPADLSENQRKCLRMYYQLRGEAMECKNKVLRENAAKSPFGRQAAAAKQAFDQKARAVEASSNGDDPRAKNELSQLREKYTTLLEKHRQWKQANASQLKDPDKDPAYQKKLQEARAFAGPIAGMAF